MPDIMKMHRGPARRPSRILPTQWNIDVSGGRLACKIVGNRFENQARPVKIMSQIKENIWKIMPEIMRMHRGRARGPSRILQNLVKSCKPMEYWCFRRSGGMQNHRKSCRKWSKTIENHVENQGKHTENHAGNHANASGSGPGTLQHPPKPCKNM